MPVPKRKTSKSRRDKRFAAKGVCLKAITVCSTCQAPVMPHQICQHCGHYKGRKIIRTKLERMRLRGKTRQEQQERKQQSSAEGKEGV